ncbi:MAG: hypothetical protein ACRC6X_01015 [Culicoidibacterales bacterium]
MGKLNFVALGGLTEIGHKLHLLEIDNDIFIFDSGMKYPEDITFGIDKVIPDMTYIRNNKKRVRAVILSNISDANIGSIQMLMEIITAPIYASKFTNAIIRKEISDKNQKYFDMLPQKKIKFGKTQILSFSMTYSIPGNLGFLIEHEYGNIVYISDYVFNQNVPQAFEMEFAQLANLKNKNILALISPVKGAETNSFGVTSDAFTKKMDAEISMSKGAVFINLFTKNMLGIQTAITITEQKKKKICVLGKKGYELVVQAVKHKAIKMAPETLVNIQKIKQADREKSVFLVLGDEGVPYDLMLHILSDTHKDIRVESEDTVIIAVPKIPGSELKTSAVIDALFKKNHKAAIIDPLAVTFDIAGIEDMKLLKNIMAPKYLIASDGEYRQMIEFKTKMIAAGQHEKSIIFADNGEWVSFENGKECKSERTNLSLEEILVDGNMIEDTDNVILKEREQLSADGVVILTVALVNKSDVYSVQYVNFQSQGFIPEKEQKQLISEINETVVSAVEKSNTSSSDVKINALKKRIQEQINQTIYRKIKRYPIVVVQFVLQSI